MSAKAWCRVMAVGVLGAALVGCANIPGGVAASSTPIEGRPYMNLGHVRHTDNMVTLFGIFPLTNHNSVREAIDAAVQSRGGDAMINVTVEFCAHYVLLFNRYMTTVEGDVIRFVPPVQYPGGATVYPQTVPPPAR